MEPMLCKILRYKLACGPIEDSDQCTHLCRLIRVFIGHSMGSQGYQKGARGLPMAFYRIQGSGCTPPVGLWVQSPGGKWF